MVGVFGGRYFAEIYLKIDDFQIAVIKSISCDERYF